MWARDTELVWATRESEQMGGACASASLINKKTGILFVAVPHRHGEVMMATTGRLVLQLCNQISFFLVFILFVSLF
jgi:hypothetical protein